jgi:hypothetical protein
VHGGAGFRSGGQILGGRRIIFERCRFGIATSEIIFFSSSQTSPKLASNFPGLAAQRGERQPCHWIAATF